MPISPVDAVLYPWHDWLIKNFQEPIGARTLEVARLLSATGRTQCRMVIFGLFKAGKSTLINELLESDQVPVGVLSTTGVPVRLSYGRRWSCDLIYADKDSATRAVPVSSPEEADAFIRIGMEKALPGGMARLDAVELSVDLIGTRKWIDHRRYSGARRWCRQWGCTRTDDAP